MSVSGNQFIDKNNSQILKGVGILLMLVHHLFYSESSRVMYDDIMLHGHGLVNEIGIFSKLCVAIFVFVSGYGLVCRYGDFSSWKPYYVSRFKKLYLNYWFIWLIFVPIGVFVFNRTFQDVYGTHVAMKACLDFLGLLHLTGQFGYNPTWWFYSCIIVLYLIFPWLNSRFEKYPFFVLTLGIFAAFIGFIPFVQPYSRYLLPFMAGMFMAKNPSMFDGIGVVETLISLCMLCFMRNFSGNLVFIVDTLICVGLAMLLHSTKHPKWLDSIMANLGKHSMNIFMFHTFIFLYWFNDLIYVTRNPILIFISLLIPCYIISVIIEFIKNRIGFYQLT